MNLESKFINYEMLKKSLMNIRKTSVLCLLLSFSLITVSQNNIPDSLANKSYKELKSKFLKNLNDSIKAQVYANAHLKKAQKEKDSLKIGMSYYFKALLKKEDQQQLVLFDSAINISLNLKNQDLPTGALSEKGSIYYNNKHLKKALDNYLLALKYNKGPKKEFLEFRINQSLALLKTRINKDEEALKLIKDNWKYVKRKNYKKNNPDFYCYTLFWLANSYRKLKLTDSAMAFTQLGLDKAPNEKNFYSQSHFVLLKGILEFDENNYKKAENSLSKSLIKLQDYNDTGNIAVNHYFLAKTHLALGDTINAIEKFIKVDSIFQITKNILPEMTGGYNFLIEHYKSKNNLEKQLEYTQKLISVDSIMTSDYKYLNEELVNEFDIPNLVRNKEAIIKKLEKKQDSSNKSITVLLFIISLVIFGLIYQARKNNIYKKRFESLLNKNDVSKTLPSKVISKNDRIKNLDLSEDLITSILLNLDKFEKDKGFLNTSINLSNLANTLDTNSNYLSKVINHYKHKNFSNYLKELRINYAFEKLKSEDTFRKYTIKAIATECGFGSSESFSKAFFKYYGIYPSYYIKRLEK